MAFRPRVLRRVLVGGAVVALSTVFLAPLATASSDSSSSLDPPGVDVPGWEAAKVSGEATGCHSEFEVNVNPAILSLRATDAAGAEASASALEAGATTLSDWAKNLPAGTPGYVGDTLNALGDKLSQAGVSATSDSEGEDALIHAEAGPVPTVKLPWQGGGPVSEEEGDCTLDLFSIIHIPLAKDLKVETEGAIGPAGYSHTESESSDNNGFIYFDNDKIDTECLATLKDIEAKTSIDGGEYLKVVSTGPTTFPTFSLHNLPESPDKNDELVDFEQTYPLGGGFALAATYKLTANQQDEGDQHVTVTGLVSELKITITGPTLGTLATITVDGIRDQSHCDIDPIAVAQPVVVEPKFTG